MNLRAEVYGDVNFRIKLCLKHWHQKGPLAREEFEWLMVQTAKPRSVLDAECDEKHKDDSLYHHGDRRAYLQRIHRFTGDQIHWSMTLKG